MEAPKSVELFIPQVRDLAKKVSEFKGTPPARVAPRKILEKIKELPEMPGLDGFRKAEEDAQQAIKDAKDDAEGQKASDALNKTRREFQAAYAEWLNKPVFLPLDRQDKAFVWGLYEKEFHTEITTTREDEIENIAKALGKSGAMEDLFAEAIEEAEKLDKGEDEKVKPELVKE